MRDHNLRALMQLPLEMEHYGRVQRRPVSAAGTFLITPRGESRHHRPVWRRRVSPRRQAYPVIILGVCKAAEVAAIAGGGAAKVLGWRILPCLQIR